MKNLCLLLDLCSSFQRTILQTTQNDGRISEKWEATTAKTKKIQIYGNLECRAAMIGFEIGCLSFGWVRLLWSRSYEKSLFLPSHYSYIYRLFVFCSLLVSSSLHFYQDHNHQTWGSLFYSKLISIGLREQLLRTSRTYCVDDPISEENQSDFNDYLVSSGNFIAVLVICYDSKQVQLFFMCFGHSFQLAN